MYRYNTMYLEVVRKTSPHKLTRSHYSYIVDTARLISLGSAVVSIVVYCLGTPLVFAAIIAYDICTLFPPTCQKVTPTADDGSTLRTQTTVITFRANPSHNLARSPYYIFDSPRCGRSAGWSPQHNSPALLSDVSMHLRAARQRPVGLPHIVLPRALRSLSRGLQH